MLKIKVTSLRPGVKLGKDIFSFDSNLLLSRGTIITEQHLKNFASRNITDVYIMEAHPRSKSKMAFEDVYGNSLAIVKSFMLEAKLGKPLDIEDITVSVNLLLEQVFDAADIFKQMRMMKEKDDYLFTHSVNVSLLSILLGRWLKCEENTIKQLGAAGLLHDIGKVYIDNSILNKPDKLTAEEFREVKKHTVMGYNLITQNEGITDDVAKAALLHHERLDGSGYPMGTKGEINFFASVVAVADIFDAITSTRSYSSKHSPYTAAEVLWEESFGKLDPKITKVFYDKITSFYVGNEVLLSNNKKGVVIYIDPSQPTRPIVMVEDEFINLAENRTVIIQEVID